MDDEVKIKLPCPFCGTSKAIAIEFFCQTYSVECDHCSVSGPSAETPSGAVEKWNVRADSEGAIMERILALAADLSDAAEDVRSLAVSKGDA